MNLRSNFKKKAFLKILERSLIKSLVRVFAISVRISLFYKTYKNNFLTVENSIKLIHYYFLRVCLIFYRYCIRMVLDVWERFKLLIFLLKILRGMVRSFFFINFVFNCIKKYFIIIICLFLVAGLSVCLAYFGL